MNNELLLKNLRTVPDFPIPGILFFDVTTLFKSSECLKELENRLYELYKDKGITKVVGIESRGFVMGALLASRLGAGFVPARKPGKLPAETIQESFAKEYGTVFVMKIGEKLKSGKPHDGRAPDYDDWQLNGDIIIYNEVLEDAFEISSMGIRVDEKSLDYQLKASGKDERRSFDYHKQILEGTLPLTIGGGIGQSRVCMLLLGKLHVGEVQASLWPKEMIKICAENGVNLL